jgi:hypothetical protein
MSKKNNVLSVVMIILAIATLLPTGTASKVNILGYNSLCSFTPVSSVILFAIAVISIFMAKKNAEE